VNPFNDYEYLGGALLRYDHFLAAALGILLYHREKPIASGASFAVATLFRIFPIFFVAGLLARDLVSADRRSLLRANRAFYVSYVTASVLILAATAPIRTPDAQTAWLAFFERITAHATVQAHNVIGLKYPFMYSHEHNLEKTIGSQEPRETRSWSVEWSEQRDRIFRQRRPLYLASVAALLGLAVLFARRAQGGEALFLGVVGAFVPLLLAHYYYCTLALIPLIFRDDRRVWSALAAFAILFTATGSIHAIARIPDLAYLAYSLEVLALLLVVLVLRIRRPPVRASARAS
jgi:hypothetical protein